ncbi:MAG: hypothetical protein IPO29_09935 [Anaerolineae bacterium]|nr:hypothetical protein [Anaerolineae bacterium]
MSISGRILAMTVGLGGGCKTLGGGFDVFGHALAGRLGVVVLDGGHDGFVLGLHAPAVVVTRPFDHPGFHGQQHRLANALDHVQQHPVAGRSGDGQMQLQVKLGVFIDLAQIQAHVADDGPHPGDVGIASALGGQAGGLHFQSAADLHHPTRATSSNRRERVK